MMNLKMWLRISILLILFASCFSNEPEENGVEIMVISSLERMEPNNQISGKKEVNIKSARNEYESFQVVIKAQSVPVRVVDVEMSKLVGENGSIDQENFKFYRPELVRVRRSSPRAQLPPGLYSDPLVPFVNPETGLPIEPHNHVREKWPGPMVPSGYEMYGIPFDVQEGQNQSIWIDVFVPKETSSGEYEGNITLHLDDVPFQKEGKSIKTLQETIKIPIKLTVWDFTLPEKVTHRNHFGGISRISQRFGVEPYSKEYYEIEEQYSKIFAEHRLNPPIPSHLLPEMTETGALKIYPERHEALKAFIQDYKVADFEVPRPPIKGLTNPHRDLAALDKQKIARYYGDYYEYLKDNDWDQRAYIYLYDEPNTYECYQRVNELSSIVKEVAPELKILVVEQTYTEDPSWPNIENSIDIWCPLFGFIDRESIESRLAKGDEVWSYTALSQRAPAYHPEYENLKNFDSPYWHIDALLLSHRTPVWMNYHYGINGLLYWSLTGGVLDEWNLPAFSHFGEHFNGGGYFIYPGTPSGISGPIASIRLKVLRDAMEDYEYLKLYEELAGRNAVLEIVSKVAPNWWETTKDPEEIFAARNFIAEEIVRLKGSGDK